MKGLSTLSKRFTQDPCTPLPSQQEPEGSYPMPNPHNTKKVLPFALPKKRLLLSLDRADCIYLDISSLQVVLATDDGERALFCLFRVRCRNHFRVRHPVFAHPKCSFHFKLLLHDTHSRKPNTSSILPSSNPLVALPAIYPRSFTRRPVPTSPLPMLIEPVPTGIFATSSNRAISSGVARG